MKDGQITVSGTAEEVIASMPLKVWRCGVKKESIDKVLRSYQVSNVKTIPGGAELRILSATPPTPGAVEETATLEDVFLYHFGERAGDDHGAL